MSSPNPPKQVPGPDRASPRSHEQLRDFLHGDAYRNVLQSLQSEDSTPIVECPDSVSPCAIFPRAALTVSEGSRDPRISGDLA